MLLSIILEQMNMSFIHVPSSERSEKKINNLNKSLLLNEIYVILGYMGNCFLLNKLFSSTNSYYIMSYIWYVPCSENYPIWSGIFRILSLQLWIILIISILFLAISTTFVGRYSCTSERQGYNTPTSSVTNILAVLLWVSLSTMPRTPSLRLLFFAWMCSSLAFSAAFQAFLTTFLIDSGNKIPIRSMDELLASGIGLAYPGDTIHLFEEIYRTQSSQIRSNYVNCSLYDICLEWAKYQKMFQYYG